MLIDLCEWIPAWEEATDDDTLRACQSRRRMPNQGSRWHHGGAVHGNGDAAMPAAVMPLGDQVGGGPQI